MTGGGSAGPPRSKCALEVLYILAALVDLARFAPLPGEARTSSLGAEPRSSRPGRPADAREGTGAPGQGRRSTEFAAEAEALTGPRAGTDGAP